MKDLYIVGAGGFGRTVAQIANDINQDQPEFNLAGFVDDAPSEQSRALAESMGTAILGGVASLEGRSGVYAIASGNGSTRMKLAERVRGFGMRPATLIHPSAQVASTASIGVGGILSLGAIVTTEARTGAFCLHNIYSLVSHDCTLGDYVTLSPYAAMLGGSICEDGAWMSTRSTLNVLTTLGAHSVLGAHALALKDVPPGAIAKGTPARYNSN